MLREAEAVLSIGDNLGDRAALVRRALDMLEALIDDPGRAPETVEFEPELVVRASTTG